MSTINYSCMHTKALCPAFHEIVTAASMSSTGNLWGYIKHEVNILCSSLCAPGNKCLPEKNIKSPLAMLQRHPGNKRMY